MFLLQLQEASCLQGPVPDRVFQPPWHLQIKQHSTLQAVQVILGMHGGQLYNPGDSKPS